MTEPAGSATSTQGHNSAVINPFALAELIAGRRISWENVADVPGMLEQLLGTPYRELFDPKYGGPLYVGHRLDESLRLVPERSPLLDIEVPKSGDDTRTPGLSVVGPGQTLRSVIKDPYFEELMDWPIFCLDLSRFSRVQISLKLPPALRTLQLARVLQPNILRSIIFDPDHRIPIDLGWVPPGGHWATNGIFFHEAAEFFDPVQGAVANCYYIAALSAVGWATPHKIAHANRASGSSQEQFLDMVRFYKPDSGGVLDKEIEISEMLPLTMSGDYLYCRSSEAGETWPAIYEKAFAKLKTGTTTDMPDITQTAWGDCVYATAQLNGGTRSYYNTANHTADQLWDILRSHCLSYRTFDPMTAWTYSTGDESPDHVDYSSAHVVGSHCYTVLGWAYRNCQRWIVLRNPWGYFEATASVLDATISMYDVSWWRPITLSTTDGVFAMEISAFKKYFAGFGVAV